jgi:hypothetical protein
MAERKRARDAENKVRKEQAGCGDHREAKPKVTCHCEA